MDGSKISAVVDELPAGVDPETEGEYAEQSKLLQEFTTIPNIDKAWMFKSDSGMVAVVYAGAFTIHVFIIVIKLCAWRC